MRSETRGYNELLTRPQTGREVLSAGRPIDTTPPDNRERDAPLGRAGAQPS